MSIGKSGVKHFEFENKKIHFTRPNLHADLIRIRNFHSLIIVTQIQVSFTFTQTSISFYCSDYSAKIHLCDETIRNYIFSGAEKKLKMWCFTNQCTVYRLDSKSLPTL